MTFGSLGFSGRGGGSSSVANVPTIAFYGDSITGAAGGNTGTTISRSAIGYATWVPILSRQRVFWPVGNNFGVAGNTTAQMLARLGDVTAARPDVCAIHGGTNDLALTYEESIANLAAMYDALLGAGCRVIAVPILPRGDVTTTLLNKILRVNQWIVGQREARRNFAVVDCSLVWTDPATGAPRPAYTADNLHPNSLGAYFIGKEIAAVLSAWFPTPLILPANPLDVYSATDNPAGNLLSNGGFTGTTGTLSNGFTGQLATGYSSNGVNTPAGGAVAFSKVTKSDGRIFQQLAFSGTYNSAAPAAQQITGPNLITNVSEGDVLEAMVEVEVDAGAQNLAFIGSQLTIAGASGRNSFEMQGDSTFTLPGEAWSGILRLPRLTVPAGATSIAFNHRWQIKGVGVSSALAATIRFGASSVRKIV